MVLVEVLWIRNVGHIPGQQIYPLQGHLVYTVGRYKTKNIFILQSTTKLSCIRATTKYVICADSSIHGKNWFFIKINGGGGHRSLGGSKGMQAMTHTDRTTATHSDIPTYRLNQPRGKVYENVEKKTWPISIYFLLSAGSQWNPHHIFLELLG